MDKQHIFENKQQKAMMRYENVAAMQLKNNPKAFYGYMNSKRKIRAAISGLKNINGELLHSAKDTANKLGAFFESTFVKEDPDAAVPELEPRRSDNEHINDLVFDQNEVKEFLQKLNIWKMEIHGT